VLAVPEDGEGIGLEALERKLRGAGAARWNGSPSSTAVTVNNPSCTILSNRRRRRCLEVAPDCREQGRWIPIF